MKKCYKKDIKRCFKRKCTAYIYESYWLKRIDGKFYIHLNKWLYDKDEIKAVRIPVKNVKDAIKKFEIIMQVVP